MGGTFRRAGLEKLLSTYEKAVMEAQEISTVNQALDDMVNAKKVLHIEDLDNLCHLVKKLVSLKGDARMGLLKDVDDE